VRALARERGVDLAQVAPTGSGGTITREDVTKAAETGSLTGAAEPLKGVRRSMALNMARSHASVAPATLFDQADVERWWSATADVTVRLIRGIAAGVAASPALNGWYDGERLERRIAGRVDLGIAVDTEAGLIVPVLRDVGSSDLAELRRAVDRMKAAVHDRTVPLADLRGATITLSNFGTLAGRHAALVIATPQIAIVGAGRIATQAVPDGSAVAFHHVLPLSLTFDHRVVTGGETGRFLVAAIADLERKD
jgi:pyruvate dehydrogenase E2 component (dihydrolipoamide acetyltransferase)